MRWMGANWNTRRVLVAKPEGTKLISRREWGDNIKMCHHIHICNRTIIRYNDIPTGSKPSTCFGIFRPSSERYSTKESTIIASYVMDI